jgi:hypothetical protein
MLDKLAATEPMHVPRITRSSARRQKMFARSARKMGPIAAAAPVRGECIEGQAVRPKPAEDARHSKSLPCEIFHLAKSAASLPIRRVDK